MLGQKFQRLQQNSFASNKHERGKPQIAIPEAETYLAWIYTCELLYTNEVQNKY